MLLIQGVLSLVATHSIDVYAVYLLNSANMLLIMIGIVVMSSNGNY